ncbi:hypothetical protein ABZ883_04985 [Streptomyces sp. NPDC046977]|uniref:hypothetical protein n=1 Tax=Streptomyces sp. NPDC046977 TaxID=3154703 RepID=UPI0033C53954
MSIWDEIDVPSYPVYRLRFNRPTSGNVYVMLVPHNSAPERALTDDDVQALVQGMESAGYVLTTELPPVKVELGEVETPVPDPADS